MSKTWHSFYISLHTSKPDPHNLVASEIAYRDYRRTIVDLIEPPPDKIVAEFPSVAGAGAEQIATYAAVIGRNVECLDIVEVTPPIYITDGIIPKVVLNSRRGR